MERQGDNRANARGGPPQPKKPGSEAPAGTTGTGQAVCPDCGGAGLIERDGQRVRCPNCSGTGTITEGIGGA